MRRQNLLRYTSAVDSDLDAAELSYGLSDRCRDGCFVGYVDGEGQDAEIGTGALEVCGDLIEPRGVEVCESEVGDAVLGELVGGGGGDSCGFTLSGMG